MVHAFESQTMDYDTRRSLCIDIGRGIQALHECDIVHGDIKMENILVFPHRQRKYIAKLADFGCTLVDADGSGSSRQLHGYSRPWNAPEFSRTMPWNDVFLTDVYSYGFLIWRAMCYGHTPFTENDGLIPKSEIAAIDTLKERDQILEVAIKSLEVLRPHGDVYSRIKVALERSLQLRPVKRNLSSCIASLVGSRTPSHSRAPLRQTNIPNEQGLGVYDYGSHNLRFERQFLHALESYCLSTLLSKVPDTTMLVDHAASTLSGKYLISYTAGDEWDIYHEQDSRSLALAWITVSAGTDQAASAEALVPMYDTFSSMDMIPNSSWLRVAATNGLIEGFEFISRDVLEQPVPRKDEFLEIFRTKFCRGAGLRLGIPKEAFCKDRHGRYSYAEYLGRPFHGMRAHHQGVFTPEYLLRIAASWGSVDTLESITSTYKVNINEQDFYGETALLRACRAGHPDVVRWLITMGKAKANLSTTKNINPLHWIGSFDTRDIPEIVRLLKSAGANPNEVAVDNEIDDVEWTYFFFKGPPLMRVVASGNVTAVRALLDIGADPTIPKKGFEENPIIFAARRLRLDVLGLLLERVPNYSLWSRRPSRYNIAADIFMCHPSYGAKIHGKRYLQALEDMFNFVWNKAESPARLFQSITPEGHIPIQCAVNEGNMALTKLIIQSCPDSSHIKQLVASIGLQSAIIYG
ncbi:ankyrin [Serendipita vermifera]|nr:ankyrin [Serendipita vermifera]